MPLPSTLMTCDAAINYLITINQDFVYYCQSQNYTFGLSCCETCYSKTLGLIKYLKFELWI